MRKGIRNIKHNSTKYRLVGRGGEGNVYEYDSDSNLAIKVYRTDSICYTDPDTFEKEIYVIRFLKDLPQVSAHIVDIFDLVPCSAPNEPRGYVMMELYDGDLDQWAKQATTKGTEVDEDHWISMIFQIVFAFTEINKNGILHGDSKPKNIFYTRRNLKDPNTDGIRSYLLDGKVVEIKYDTRFVLGDFSRVRIAELDPDYSKGLAGLGGSEDMYFDLTHRSDLYELSRLLYRVMVNSALRTYSEQKVENLVKHHSEINPAFKTRILQTEQEIKNMAVPSHIENRMRLRMYLYELIESDYITQEMLRDADPQLVLPSERVQNILQNIAEPDTDLFDLFNS